jgi:hypothetical protein
MRVTVAALALSAALTGCATVKMNDGNTVAIEWDHSGATREQVQEVAVKSCQEAGKRNAEQIADVSMNPALPAWMVKRVVTFRCV